MKYYLQFKRDREGTDLGGIMAIESKDIPDIGHIIIWRDHGHNLFVEAEVKGIFKNPVQIGADLPVDQENTYQGDVYVVSALIKRDLDKPTCFPLNRMNHRFS